MSLPKPVGLFACYDIRGRQALDACRRAGLSVPDNVAVLGVDDEKRERRDMTRIAAALRELHPGAAVEAYFAAKAVGNAVEFTREA